MLDNRARAQTDVVHDELGGRDANDQAVAPLERGVDLVAGGNRLPAHRAGWRVRVELPDRAGQQVQEFLDHAKSSARGTVPGPGLTVLVGRVSGL